MNLPSSHSIIQGKAMFFDTYASNFFIRITYSMLSKLYIYCTSEDSKLYEEQWYRSMLFGAAPLQRC